MKRALIVVVLLVAAFLLGAGTPERSAKERKPDCSGLLERYRAELARGDADMISGRHDEKDIKFMVSTSSTELVKCHNPFSADVRTKTYIRVKINHKGRWHHVCRQFWYTATASEFRGQWAEEPLDGPHDKTVECKPIEGVTL